MLLAAGFICFFFAPSGWRPGLGEKEPPSRATLFLLRLLWFTIYFESGVAKYFGGDPSWRDFSAMNEYYQNGPLPTWIGWYAHQWPRWLHQTSAFLTVFTELVIVCMIFLPRVFRVVCFFWVTFLQIGIILTANYAFLNYIVLALGVFLVDDAFLLHFVPQRWCSALRQKAKLAEQESSEPPPASAPDLLSLTNPVPATALPEAFEKKDALGWRSGVSAAVLWFGAFLLTWVLYATAYLLVQQISPGTPLPAKPVALLEPFRVANSYGLFGRMTWSRYEIEFQGSEDGQNWIAYPFRYKPQDVNEAPGIYAPYQPRFEWNLWFASLGGWRENPFVVRTEQQLLLNNPDILALFRSNPFAKAPPVEVRAEIWQYWFTDRATRKATGAWWRREDRGLYAPSLRRTEDGQIVVAQWPQGSLPPP